VGSSLKKIINFLRKLWNQELQIFSELLLVFNLLSVNLLMEIVEIIDDLLSILKGFSIILFNFQLLGLEDTLHLLDGHDLIPNILEVLLDVIENLKLLYILLNISNWLTQFFILSSDPFPTLFYSLPQNDWNIRFNLLNPVLWSG
jgi:hypothetical protein